MRATANPLRSFPGSGLVGAFFFAYLYLPVAVLIAYFLFHVPGVNSGQSMSALAARSDCPLSANSGRCKAKPTLLGYCGPSCKFLSGLPSIAAASAFSNFLMS